MMYAAGVPEKRIMEVVGWKRVEMLHRYLIGSEEAAVQTGVQMDSFMAARTAARATEDVASRTENRKVN
jgi:hypothetical protein